MNSLRGWILGASVVVGAIVICAAIWGAFSSVLLLFTAVLLSSGLRPFIDRMAQRMPFGTAAALAFTILIVLAAIIGFALLQPLAAEIMRLVQSVPGYAASLQGQLSAAQKYFANDQTARQIASAVAGGAGGAVTSLGQRLLGGPALVAAVLGDGVLILLLAVGWTLSVDDLQRFVLSLMPPAIRTDWQGAFAEMGSRLSAYVQGVVLNGGLVGVVMGGSLALLGIPYAVLLGFITAIFQAIPMIGAGISGLIILPVVLATSGWTKMWIVLAVFGVVQAIDQNVLSPIIFGSRVQLSFLLIILSTIVGGTLFGIAGAFLAVPAAAVIQVLIVRIVAPAIRQSQV
jgi:predicted PurR-regulated permease PerM